MVTTFPHSYVAPTDPRAPVVLALHGTGGTEHDLVEIVSASAPGAGIISPRGQVNENGMNRWFRRFAVGVYDVEDIHRRARELAEWVGEFRTAHDLGLRPLVAYGYSNGANIALALLIILPDLLSGAALLRPSLIFEPPINPNWLGKRVLLAFGTADPYSRPNEAERLIDIANRSHAHVTTYWHPGGHELSAADYEKAAALLRSSYTP